MDKNEAENKKKKEEFEKTYFTCLAKTALPMIFLMVIIGFAMSLIDPTTLHTDFEEMSTEFVNISGKCIFHSSFKVFNSLRILKVYNRRILKIT